MNFDNPKQRRARATTNSKMEFIGAIVNAFHLLATFKKSSILDVAGVLNLPFERLV